MAQWTFIDPNTLLPGDPWTSAKAQAAFENLEAVAEGAPGAPKVVSEGLDMFVGTGFSATYIDLDRVDKVILIARMDTGLTANYALSSDNGATFGSNTSYTFSTVVSLGSNNAIRLHDGTSPRSHIIIGVSGVKP